MFKTVYPPDCGGVSITFKGSISFRSRASFDFVLRTFFFSPAAEARWTQRKEAAAPKEGSADLHVLATPSFLYKPYATASQAEYADAAVGGSGTAYTGLCVS